MKNASTSSRARKFARIVSHNVCACVCVCMCVCVCVCVCVRVCVLFNSLRARTYAHHACGHARAYTHQICKCTASPSSSAPLHSRGRGCREQQGRGVGLQVQVHANRCFTDAPALRRRAGASSTRPWTMRMSATAMSAAGGTANDCVRRSEVTTRVRAWERLALFVAFAAAKPC